MMFTNVQKNNYKNVEHYFLHYVKVGLEEGYQMCYSVLFKGKGGGSKTMKICVKRK